MHCVSGACTLSIGNWHMHDALWHISLAKLGFVSWPLQNPFLAGESLYGYNYLLDFLLYLLLKLGISPFFGFFKILPVIAGVLYVWSVWRFIASRTSNAVKANLLAFFLYFGSSFSYLATLYRDHTFFYSSLRGFPVVSSVQPATMFLNLQFAFSLSIILWILIILQNNTFKWRSPILGILFFLLFGFKFYGGIVGLAIAVSLGKKFRDLITIGIGSFLGLFIFYGISSLPTMPFTWSPFALTHLLIDDPLLFYHHGLTLARYYLYENNVGFSPRLFAIEALSVVLFLLMNFGPRLIAVFYKFAFINLIIIITALVPILFVQDGGWYNTMQFLYYGVWLSGVLMAEMLFELLNSNHRWKYIFLWVIILLTIPNNLEQLRLIKAEQNVISSDELKAMEVLRSSPAGSVHIFNSEHKYAVVPALGEKSTYYLDTDQLMVTHAPYQDRLAFMTKYSGGSITTVPAGYYLIYKTEWGTSDAIRALTSPTQYELIYDSVGIALYRKL